ncbi:MAG: hypothetical protein ACE5RA_03595 [Nitrosopumilus sp.]
MNWGLVIGVILALIFVVVILSIALPPYLNYLNDEHQRELFEEMNKGNILMCGTPEELGKIFDTIDIISSDGFDNKAKSIYQQIQWGKDVESCDIIYFYNQLDDEQKKKLNWLELSCNVRDCPIS